MKLQLWLLVLLASVYSLHLINAQEIKAVLDDINFNVQGIANQASSNVQRICESLSQCTQQNCSRTSCRPQGKQEIETLTCLAVDNNPDCSGSCRQSVSVSTNKSYLRLAPLASESNYELQMSICAQKPLDRKLQQVWQNISKSYQGVLFFGAAEGFIYTYPGRDYVGDGSCVEYDPRKRPWYINSLAVVKSVQILIDTSGSMGNRVGPLSLESCLQASQNIVSELLNTFTNEDRVAVSDLSGKSIGSSVQVSLDGITISGQQAEIKTLQGAVNSLKAQDQSINFKAALSGALQFFGSSTDLKVLLVFSNGQFISNLNFTELGPVFTQFGNVVIFFYEMGFGDLNQNSIQALKTSLNMTNEVVKDEDNPLFKVRSYFDYLAWLRYQSVNKTPTWVPLYTDASGFGNVTTATFPAFDSNNRLVGVAGIDLIANRFINELGLSVVQDAVSERSPVPSHQKTFTAPQTKPVLTPNCSQNVKLTPMCPRLDTSTPIQNFICCANCSGGASSNNSSLSAGAIGGIVAGGAVALVALAVLLLFAYKKLRNRPVKPPPPPIPQPEPWIMPKQSPSPNRES